MLFITRYVRRGFLPHVNWRLVRELRADYLRFHARCYTLKFIKIQVRELLQGELRYKRDPRPAFRIYTGVNIASFFNLYLLLYIAKIVL